MPAEDDPVPAQRDRREREQRRTGCGRQKESDRKQRVEKESEIVRAGEKERAGEFFYLSAFYLKQALSFCSL